MKHLDLIPLLTIALEKMLRLDAIRQPLSLPFLRVKSASDYCLIVYDGFDGFFTDSSWTCLGEGGRVQRSSTPSADQDRRAF